MGNSEIKEKRIALDLKNDQVEKIIGIWFEISVLSTEFERGCEGSVASYSDLNTKENTFLVTNHCIFKTQYGNYDWKCRIGKGKKMNDSKAEFFVFFSNMPEFLRNKGFKNYNIIDFCFNNVNESYLVILGSSDSYFWILSRNPNFSLTGNFYFLKQKYKNYFADQGMKIRDPLIYKIFEDITQESCKKDSNRQESAPVDD